MEVNHHCAFDKSWIKLYHSGILETLAMKGLILNCMSKKDEAYDHVRRGEISYKMQFLQKNPNRNRVDKFFAALKVCAMIFVHMYVGTFLGSSNEPIKNTMKL